jgi:hypothetical protein
MERSYSIIFVFILIFCSSILGGCIHPNNDSTIISAELNAPFQLQIDQMAIIKSENIKIIFVNVTEDSRCPSDVECVWEGQVTIVINILKNKQVQGEFNLTSRAGINELAIKEFDEYVIELLVVDPYPISTKKIELEDYITTLNVSKSK